MFDVSFTELLTIAAVALVVIGPERLPKVARTIGHLLGRAQRYVNDVKSDIRREVELDELRNLRKEMEDAARSLESTVRSNADELQKGFQEVQTKLEDSAREVKDLAQADTSSPASAVAEAVLPPEAPGAAPDVDKAAALMAAAAATVTASVNVAGPAAVQTDTTQGPSSKLEPADSALPDSGQASLFPADVLPLSGSGEARPAAATTARDPEKT